MLNIIIPFLIITSISCLGNTTAITEAIINISHCIVPRSNGSPSPYLYGLYIFHSVIDRNPIREATKGVSGIYC
jgi:hypothetical protein